MTDAEADSQMLGDRCIRILHLSVVDAGRDNSPLRGVLKSACLDDNPTFAALSYTWGPDAAHPLQQIICSDRTIPITQNCYDALSTLKRNFNIRKIWVDAICINQDDDLEKGGQVPLMRDIYGKASRVYVWLGNGTQESDLAIEWMRWAAKDVSVLLGARFKAFPGIMAPKELLKAWRLIPLLIEKYKLKGKSPPAYDAAAMLDIANRDWFGRMWTLQELVMAHEPLVVCGQRSIRWADISFSLVRARNIAQNRSNSAFTKVFNSVITAESFWIDQSQKYRELEGNVRNWAQRDGVVPRLWHRCLDVLESTHPLLGQAQDCAILSLIIVRLLLGQRPINSLWLLFVVITRLLTRTLTPHVLVRALGTIPPWEKDIRWKLPGIMNKIRSRDAKLPVDKIFALCGIFDELGIPIQRPDYTKPVSQVYTEFTCDLLNWLKSLELLSEASMPSTPGGPSWVPDWSVPHYRICTGDFKAAGESQPNFKIVNGNNIGGRYSVESLTSTGTPHEEWTSTDFRRDPTQCPKILTKGVVVDSIGSCLPLFQREDKFHATENGKLNEDKGSAFLANIGILRSWLSTTSTTKSDIDRLFNVAHAAPLTVEYRSENLPLFSSWINLLTTEIDVRGNTDSSSSTAEAAARMQSILMDRGLYEYHNQRVVAMTGKRGLFKTENSRLGTGPLAMEKGDVVVLLAGFSCPMILRASQEMEDTNRYKVVGVAYIEGLMQGEAWPEDEEKVVEIELV